MKIAVSIPDDVFDEAELLVQRLGTSRSEVYARALAAFVNEHDADQVTQALNAVIGAARPESDAFAGAAARRVLDSVEW